MSVDWSSRYETGATPWEKGEPHPELPFLLSTHRELVAGAEMILVPGCGYGHDANLISSVAEGEMQGLDLVKAAVREAERRYSGDGKSWAVGDLFEWEGSYDLVFEHTCFCAIPVERRREYAEAMARLIPAGGHLLGVFFLNPDHEGEEGPPFGVSTDELGEFFCGEFELVWSKEPTKTYGGREGEGRELSMLWRRGGKVC